MTKFEKVFKQQYPDFNFEKLHSVEYVMSYFNYNEKQASEWIRDMNANANSWK